MGPFEGIGSISLWAHTQVTLSLVEGPTWGFPMLWANLHMGVFRTYRKYFATLCELLATEVPLSNLGFSQHHFFSNQFPKRALSVFPSHFLIISLCLILTRCHDREAHIILKAGKNHNSWFGSEHLIAQVDKAINIFEGLTKGNAQLSPRPILF
jgi:hypothetical protein